MLIDLLKAVFTTRAQHRAHRAVEAQLTRDREAWACSFRQRRRDRHTARRATCPTPRHDWRRAIAPLAVAATLAVAAVVGWRAMTGDPTPDAPALDPAGAMALGDLIERVDRAPIAAFGKEWTNLAADAEAGFETVLALLPGAPAADADPPGPNATRRTANQRTSPRAFDLPLPRIDLDTLRRSL